MTFLLVSPASIHLPSVACADPLGRGAARIGRVVEDHPGPWSRGGRRVVDLPFAEPLPRIC